MIATALLLLATLAPIPVAGQTNAWWSGHPSVDGGRPIEAKEVNISLFTSKGCNTGGDGECTKVALGGAFRGVRYTELGLVLFLALVSLLLGVANLKINPSRSKLAKAVMVAAMISAIGSIVLLVMGPDIISSKPVAVPMGPGLILFFIGTALSIGAAVIALMPYHQPLPRSLPAMPMPAPLAPQPAPIPGFDVEALLAEGDAVRPSAPHLSYPQSPGGALPGPAGPLMPQSGPQPLFHSAPSLRPLYEVNGAGLPPPPPAVQFPTRPPTPIGMAAVNAALGLDTPAAGQPVVTAIPVPPIPQPPKLPPPSRTKPPSIAPPLPGLAKRPPPPATRPPPPATKPPPPKGSPTMMSAAVPMPPPAPPARPSADDMLKTADFEKHLSTGDSTDNIDAELPFDTSTAENSTSAFQREAPEKAFTSEENTDIGEPVDDLETAAREKIEASEVGGVSDAIGASDGTEQSAPAPSDNRASMTEVELANRPSGTEVELNAAPRVSSTAVISSAAPPPKHTPAPKLAEPEAAASAKIPVSTAPDSLPPPTEAPVANSPSPACPQCEAPMRWVEEHLRFFCKSCRMYF